MPFEARVRDLSQQLANCGDDVLALKLARELQRVLHEEIERLRDKASGMHLLNQDKKNTRV